MKRDDFLKLIGSGGGTMLFSGLIHPAFTIAYTLQKIKVYDNYIKGTHFYKKDFSALKLETGQEVSLIREPGNPYDRFTIKVMVQNKQIGFIAAYENIVLANLLDKGVSLAAHISELQPQKEEGYLHNVVAISVFAELMVPASAIEVTTLTKDRADNSYDVYRQGYKTVMKNKKNK